MKQVILDVLEDLSQGQINLTSKGARETIASSIIAAIKSEGWYIDLAEKKNDDTCKHGNSLNSTCSVCDEQQIRESWVCDVCGKNTFDADFDYLVHPKLHLGCALEEEAKGKDIKEQYLKASKLDQQRR